MVQMYIRLYLHKKTQGLRMETINANKIGMKINPVTGDNADDWAKIGKYRFASNSASSSLNHLKTLICQTTCVEEFCTQNFVQFNDNLKQT